MLIDFTKMHGLGNDFIVINNLSNTLNLTADHARYLADRHRGIGCDQLLIIEKPTSSNADFRYRIYNADGSEVAQCGNGARCFALFIKHNQLSDKNDLLLETKNGIIQTHLQNDNLIRVEMGLPEFNPAKIPFLADKQSQNYQLIVGKQPLNISAISIGNPHAVLSVDDAKSAAVDKIGPLIEKHPLFPEGANVNFMEIIDRSHIRLRVFERGTGETLACGSGACASMASGYDRGLLDNKVLVSLPGGDLTVSWSGNTYEPVFLTGPATSIYKGKIEI